MLPKTRIVLQGLRDVRITVLFKLPDLLRKRSREGVREESAL